MGKNTLKYFLDPLITGQSMAASFNGTPTNIQEFDNVCYQLSWSGANPIGVIKVQTSLDFDPRSPSAATWTPLKDSGTDISISPGGAPGTGIFDLNQLPGMWVRLVYTTSGGSIGVLTSKIGLKGLQ